MSLRARLLAILALAAVTLVAAALAVWHVVEATDAARVSNATTSVDAAAVALVEVWSRHPDDSDGRQREARAALAALIDAQGGFCGAKDKTTERYFIGREGPPPLPPMLSDGSMPPPRPPPPDIVDAMNHICETPGTTTRLDHQRDVLVFASHRIDGERTAWAMRRVAIVRDPQALRWQLDVTVLAIATAALVSLVLGGLLGLGRGVRELEGGVAKLAGDLRSPLPRPAMKELKAIADAIGALAVRLADASERERDLSRDLAHRERLAALGRVVAGVAHEIRNPLAGLKLKLDLLARDPALAEEALADVKTCLGEVGRLDRVVSSLLVATRRDDGPRTSVALGGLVDERVALLAETTGERHVTVERKGDAVATASRDALARVVDNLLRNAVEACPEGERVEVRIEERNGLVVLSVRDRGEGPKEGSEARLFEPFFTTKKDGTGLGLFLSRALVAEHGGELLYERTTSGSEFRVTLPRIG